LLDILQIKEEFNEKITPIKLFNLLSKNENDKIDIFEFKIIIE
jgi:hypothetical protein